MTTPREAIVPALIARLEQMVTGQNPNGTPIYGFPTVRRYWKGVDASLTLDLLPALFLIELNEKHTVRGRGMPAIIDWVFDVVFVIQKVEGVSEYGRLNPLLDALDTLFLPAPADRVTGRNTLGGLVYDVWIEGTVVKNPAFLGGGASLAVAPLHVRITNPS